MGNDQKDRFGDKLRDIEKGREDDYFARRDRELLEKMRRSKEPPAAGQGGSGESGEGAEGGSAPGEHAENEKKGER